MHQDLGEIKGKPFGFYFSPYTESLALLKEEKEVPVAALETSVIEDKGEGEQDDKFKEVSEYEGSEGEEDGADEEGGEVFGDDEIEGELIEVENEEVIEDEENEEVTQEDENEGE